MYTRKRTSTVPSSKLDRLRLQSAMEYLMTYGWAILIVAVVLAALFELGVFNGLGGAQACIAQAGFICKNPIYTASSITFTFGQTNGRDYYGNWVFVASQGEALNQSGIPVNLTCTQTGCANAVTVGLPGPDGVRALVPGQTVAVVFPANVFPAGAVPSNPPISTQFAGYVWFGYCTAQPCPAPTSFSKVATLTIRSSASFLGPTTTSSSVTSSSTTTTTTTTTTTSSSSSTTSTTSTTTTSTTTIQQCLSSQGYNGGPCNGNVVFDTSTTLTSDVKATGSITIDGGVTVTSNGYSFIAGSTFTNSGTIDAGSVGNGGASNGGNGGNAFSSYGGSGGGGASTSQCCGPQAGSGGSTFVPGGSPNANGAGSGFNYGGNGQTAPQPGWSSSQITMLYNNGIQNYLEGAGGGGAGSGGGGDVSGGSGSYGLFIEGTTVSAGSVNLAGQNGGYTDDACNGIDVASAGSGGGGSLLIVYLTSQSSSPSQGGGTSTPSQSCNGQVFDVGGSGGSGITIPVQYSGSPPVTP